MTVKPKPAPSVKSTTRNMKVKAASSTMVAAIPPANQAFQDISKTKGSSAQCLTPLQRLQQLVSQNQLQGDPNLRVVSSVQELQELLKADKATGKFAMEMKLLWASDHTYKEWSLTRLHFTDATTPESLHDQVKGFREQYDTNPDAVNSLLLTATMWDMVSTSEDLPPPGSIVRINNYMSLKLFRDEQCQVTEKLRDLSWQKDAE